MNELNNISEELKNMDSLLADLPKRMPYSVPVGYFEQLADNITTIACIQDDIPDFGHTLAYQVPDGYFDALPAQMLQMLQSEKINKSIPPKKHFVIPAIKWAAAAVLAIGISAGGYLVVTTYTAPHTETILASVQPNDITLYLQHSYGIDANTVANSTHINNLDIDSKDIVAYLDETGWD